jgi:hypothetical protein
MENTPPTNELIERLTRSLSPEAHEILERVEALAPIAETDPADPEPAVALIESLPDADRTAIYRIMGLKARAYHHRGEGTRKRRDSPHKPSASYTTRGT